jgi:hypothetical protein
MREIEAVHHDRSGPQEGAERANVKPAYHDPEHSQRTSPTVNTEYIVSNHDPIKLGMKNLKENQKR